MAIRKPAYTRLAVGLYGTALAVLMCCTSRDASASTGCSNWAAIGTVSTHHERKQVEGPWAAGDIVSIKSPIGLHHNMSITNSYRHGGHIVTTMFGSSINYQLSLFDADSDDMGYDVGAEKSGPDVSFTFSCTPAASGTRNPNSR